MVPGILRLLLGGGSGKSNNACDNITIPQAAGGNGGGIIYISPGTITNCGSLLTNGKEGGNTSWNGTSGVVGTTALRFNEAIGTPGSNLLTNSFLLPNNGTVSVTLTEVLNGEGVSPTLGSPYQNSVTVSYLNLFRRAGGTQVSPGGLYTPGGAVSRSNYPSSASTKEDVTVTGGTATLTVIKSNGGNTLIAGHTTIYTITLANLGGSAAPSTVLKNPVATGLNCTTVTCASTTGVASCPWPLSMGVLQSTGLSITPSFDVGSTVAFVVSCGGTATGQ